MGWREVTKSIQLMPLLLLLPRISTAKCDFSKVNAELKPYVLAFVDAEKFSLGDKFPLQKDAGKEFLFRVKTRDWQNYAWDVRPLQITALNLAQNSYAQACGAQAKPFFANFLAQFEKEKHPDDERKKFLRTVLLFSPCAGDEDASAITKITNKEFKQNTESFVSLIIAVESEIPNFHTDYAACLPLTEKQNSKVVSKFLISDSFLRGIDDYVRDFGVDKTLLLRLKKLRPAKLHFESGKYLFKNLDEKFSSDDKS
jgi:hypothetical protein